MIRFKIAPLSGSFMITSIVGFLVSVMFIKQYSLTWSFTGGFFFLLMFLASVLSVTYGPETEELNMDKHRVKIRK